MPEPRTRSRRPHPRRPLLAGALVLLIAAGYLALWQVLVESRSGGGDWDGFAEAMLLTYVGVPVALGLTWWAFRRAGATSATVGAGALLLAMFLVPWVPFARQLPPLAWPFVLGGLAVGYLRWEATVTCPPR